MTMHVLQALLPGTQNTPVPVAVDPTGRLIIAGATPVDTDGAVLPSGLPLTYTNRPDGQPLTATLTDGTSTWVYTWTYDASGYVTAESGWVMQ